MRAVSREKRASRNVGPAEVRPRGTQQGTVTTPFLEMCPGCAHLVISYSTKYMPNKSMPSRATVTAPSSQSKRTSWPVTAMRTAVQVVRFDQPASHRFVISALCYRTDAWPGTFSSSSHTGCSPWVVRQV